MATGVLWPSFAPEDGSRIRKWLYGNVLIRDWDAGGSTAMQNIQVFVNNNLNPLLLVPIAQGGYGFYDAGNITENGVSFTPQFNADETYVWQSRKTQRTDITKDDEEVMFSLADSTPLVDFLWNNLPIGTAGTGVVPALGSANYSVSKPFYSDVVWRQLLIIGVDGSVGPNGQPEYLIEMRPRVALSKKAKRQWAAKQIDVTDLTFYCHVDPFSGWDQNRVRGGIVWTDEGGPVTLPLGVAQTPPSVNTASILSPTISVTPSGTGGTFAAGTYYWVLTSTNAAGETVRSNEVTATLSGTTSSAAINWTQITGATGYKLYRGTGAGAENSLITTIGSGSTVTYTDTGTAGSAGSPPSASTANIAAPTTLAGTPATTGGNLPAVQEFWVVTAKTAAGETTGSNEINTTFTTATSSSSLTWTAVTGATSYNVYRGLAAAGENLLVANVATAALNDTGSVVAATAIGSGKATVVLNQPTSGNGPFTYTVQQSNNNGVSFTAASVLTSTLAGVVQTITVQSLTPTNTYIFKVTAAATNGNSAIYPNSNSITAS